MSDVERMFETATRKKIRFNSAKGDLTVEQLWEVPLRSTNTFNLDYVARMAKANLDKIDEESFVDNTTNPAKGLAEVAFNLVKYVISVKKSEEELAEKRHVVQPVAVPAPDDVAAWLRQTGWTLTTSNDAWAVFEASRGGEAVSIEVPQRAGARDFPRAMATLLDDLARIEGRPPISLLRDIHASAVDIVRIAIEGASTREGRMPVEAGRRVFGAARDLLLAATCSVLDPRPAYATRKPDNAMQLLEHARFGQSEVGSFVVTLETTVPPRLDFPFRGDGDPGAPLERRATLHLARAVAAAELATRRAGAAGGLAPYQEQTRQGVSANLCDAVAELLEAASADTVRTSFSFAHRRPVVVDVPRTVTFSADMAPTLRSAAAGLRAVSVLPEQELIGLVVVLESGDASAGGAVQLRTPVDGRMLAVRVHLPPEAYAVAIEAHRSRTLVRCVGDLAREGRSRVLRNARDFAVTTEEEEG